MKNFFKYLSYKKIWLSVLIFSLILASCGKSEENVTEGETIVNINLSGSVADGDDLELSEDNLSVQTTSLNQSDLVQTRTIPYDDEHALVATLVRTGIEVKNMAVSNTDMTTLVNKAVATPVQTPIAAGVKYKVLVYNAAGTLVQQQDFVYGQPSAGFILDAGVAYTFVAYSVNSSSLLPTVTNGTTLSTATLSNVTADLMYFKKQVTLNYGTNNLSVVLKHMYSQINTIVRTNGLSNAVINSIGTTVIKPTRANASLNLSSGVLTYGTIASAGATVQFGAFGGSTVTSTATQLITPAVTNGTIDLATLSLSGLTKGPLTLSNLKINPGCKYNLDLSFTVPCTQNVTTNTAFNVSNGVTKTFDAPGADFGFVMDIYTLDNSFNLQVNGVSIATKELQFDNTVTTLPRNVKFADGAIYNGAVVPIYNLTGTAANPLVRVVISASGAISLFGSKTSGGPLFPLVLESSQTSFNTITWNKTAANTLILSQTVTGPTYMTGSGSGRKIILCN